MTAEELLTILERNELVPRRVVEDLRRQAAKSPKPLDPQAIARLLVQKGHLTTGQAFRLLDDNKADVKPTAAADAAPRGIPRPGSGKVPETKPAEKKTPSLEDDLGLGALDDNLGLTPLDDDLGLSPLDDFPDAATKPAASTKSNVSAKPGAGKKTLAEAGKGGAKTGGNAGLELGSFDDLLSESAMGGASDPLSAAQAGGTLLGQEPRGASKKKKQLLAAAGALVAVLVIAGVVAIVINRPRGDEDYEAAERSYQGGNYEEAIGTFTQALRDYPTNRRASQTRVHLGMAQLRQAAGTGGQWRTAVPLATEVLERIAGEADFLDVQAQVAPLLIEMAESTAQQAKRAGKPDEARHRLTLAQQALALLANPRYVPAALRPWQQIETLDDTLALLARDQGRGAALDEAIAAIEKAVAAREPAEAYARRERLLAAYPELATDEKLAELSQATADAEVAAMITSNESIKSQKDEPPTPIQASIVLAGPAQPAGAIGPEGTLFTLVEGAAYALDAASGKLLWRRYVGPDTQFVPQAIGDQAKPDAIVVDSVNNSILRVDGATGRLRWRHPLDQPLEGDPLILSKSILASDSSGRIVEIDSQTGDSSVQVRLPQPPAASPVADGQRLFQVGRHSNLYSLTADLKCERVVYIGHGPGGVQVPPVVLKRHLIVADNHGAEDAVLHVVSRDATGLPEHVVSQVAVVGHIITPPIVSGKQLIVLTDRGPAQVFDINESAGSPLTKSGEIALSADTQPLTARARHALAQQDQLWITDAGLGRFDIQSDGRIVRKAFDFSGDRFDTPPQAVEDAVFYVRRPHGKLGTIATLARASDGKVIWEKTFAQPFADTPLIDAMGAILTCSSGGSVFKVDMKKTKGATVDEQTPAEMNTFWEGLMEASPGGWRTDMFAYPSAGEVSLQHLPKGESVPDPFIPRIDPRTPPRWFLPVIVGESKNEVVLFDLQNRLYRVGIEKDPRPRLAQRATAALDVEVASSLAAAGNAIYFMDDRGIVHAIQLPDLNLGESFDLGAHSVTWGPRSAGNLVLLATDRGELVCFDGAEKMLWKVPLPNGPPTGFAPLVVGKEILLAFSTGMVSRISAETGDVIGTVDIGQPLDVGPVAFDKSLIVSTPDGCLLRIHSPGKQGE